MLNDAEVKIQIEALETVLRASAPAAVAVSGGVDSMTLAFIAHRVLGNLVQMFHAVSPAVPPSATERVKAHAVDHGWQLHIIDAGEFNDGQYVANPADRCFYCKNNLYATICRLTDNTVFSGTNLDDLDDWRPGLLAAKKYAVKHPFVEAEVDKSGIRAIARSLGLADVAALPAAPCLSSRVETGIPINAPALRFIDEAERLVRSEMDATSVRCRVRKAGIVIELDELTEKSLANKRRHLLTDAIREIAKRHGVNGGISFAQYQRGSAFVR